MRSYLQVLLVIFSLTLPQAALAAQTYTVDPAHTSFAFTVKHMLVSNVPGVFEKCSGTITYDPNDLGGSKASVRIDVNSINTRIEKRDNHLRSPDFFDAAKYPEITFVSTKFTPGNISGDLTMKGVTRNVTIPVTISGPVKGMTGGQAIGITGSLTVNRQDYGISWNRTLDQGGVLVGNDVSIVINIEADTQ